MGRTQRPIDEQLKEAQERKAKAAAKLQALEAKKRQLDNKARGKARQTLMRVVLDQMATRPDFKNTIAELVKITPLRPDELDAINWLLSTLDQPGAAHKGNPAPAPDAETTARVA